jgi:hypothetical protein
LGDETLAEILNDEACDYTTEDQVLEAIINEGKDESVDQAIKYLQLLYEKRKPIPLARIGGKAGLQMSRIAFAIMIKFSDLLDIFQMIVNAIQIQIELNDDKNEIMSIIKEQESSGLIIDKWLSAANMRQWINEKKKNVMTKLEKQAENELKEKKGVPIDSEIQFAEDEK